MFKWYNLSNIQHAYQMDHVIRTVFSVLYDGYSEAMTGELDLALYAHRKARRPLSLVFSSLRWSRLLWCMNTSPEMCLDCCNA